jgi:hypothetical protein
MGRLPEAADALRKALAMDGSDLTARRCLRVIELRLAKPSPTK